MNKAWEQYRRLGIVGGGNSSNSGLRELGGFSGPFMIYEKPTLLMTISWRDITSNLRMIEVNGSSWDKCHIYVCIKWVSCTL